MTATRLIKPSGFKVIHQTIAITDIDFDARTMRAWTELEVISLRPNLRTLVLNCRQCRIHGIYVNGAKIPVDHVAYFDPLADVAAIGSGIGGDPSATPPTHDGVDRSTAMPKNMVDFCEVYFRTALPSVDSSLGGGELSIRLPTSLKSSSYSDLRDGDLPGEDIITKMEGDVINSVKSLEEPTKMADDQSFKVLIEFSLQNPKGGIAFRSLPDIPTMQKMNVDKIGERDDPPITPSYRYVFTTGGTSGDGTARLWFPCLDTCSRVNTWRIEVTVPGVGSDGGARHPDPPMTVVASGDLVDVVVEGGSDGGTPNLAPGGSGGSRTFCYALNIPTAAPYIGLVVGNFEMSVDPHMHELTNFCTPGLRAPLMAYTTSQVHTIFEFYEELLSSRFPYSCYKQVFVDDLTGAYDSESYVAYATFTLFDARVLHPPQVIDQIWDTRRCLARAIATQFFGRFLTIGRWSEHWLTVGAAAYITGLYVQKIFGNNEYRYDVFKTMEQLYEYETTQGAILLDASRSPNAQPSLPTTAGADRIGRSSRAKGNRSRPDAGRDEGRQTVPTKTAPTSAGSKMHLADPPDAIPYLNLHPQLASVTYGSMLEKKATLFVRMIEMRIGKNMLIQVFNKLLTLAINAAQGKPTPQNPEAWSHFLLSVPGFIKFIYTVTGKDLQSFFDLWVYQAGMVNIHGSYSFSRKKSLLELDLRQEINKKAHFKYVGPLQVRVQEMDGNFTHTINVEESNRKYDIPCQSKTKTYRNKKKKVPLFNGDEADIDLSMAFETECPVLWITLDPDMLILGSTWNQGLRQPDYQWQMMLRYERDVVSQCRALRALTGFSHESYHSIYLKNFSKGDTCQPPSATVQTRNLLNEIIEDTTLFILNNPGGGMTHPHQLSSSIALHTNSNNPNSISNLLSNLSTGTEPSYNHHFYRIRIDACFALARVANSMAENWVGPPAMLNLARKLFGTPGHFSIVRKNDFTDFQSYFLQCAMPLALCQLRTGTVRQVCPPEIVSHLMDCFKYNDNSENKYSDYKLRSNLITALAHTISPSTTLFEAHYGFQSIDKSQFNTDEALHQNPTITASELVEKISPELRKILGEVTCQLNLEKLAHNASYRSAVTVACLSAIRHLRHMGHLPLSCSHVIKSYVSRGNFLDVRLAGLEAMIQIIKDKLLVHELDWIFTSIIEDDDESPLVKHLTLRLLIKHLFAHTESSRTPDSESFGNRQSGPQASGKKPLSISTIFKMSDSQELAFVEKFWYLINDAPQFVNDSRLRCDAIELFHAIYGNLSPACVEEIVPTAPTISAAESQAEDIKLLIQTSGLPESLEPNQQSLDPLIPIPNLTDKMALVTRTLSEENGNVVDMELEDVEILEIDSHTGLPKAGLTGRPAPGYSHQTSSLNRTKLGTGFQQAFTQLHSLPPPLPNVHVPATGTPSSKTLNFQDKFRQHLLKEENLSSAQSSHDNTEKGSLDGTGDRDDDGHHKNKKKKHKHHKKHHKVRHSQQIRDGVDDREGQSRSRSKEHHKHKHSKKSKRKRSSS